MPTPSSNPRGEHPGRPGTRWETALVWTGEEVLLPDDEDTAEPTLRPNRATRRAARRGRKDGR